MNSFTTALLLLIATLPCAGFCQTFIKAGEKIPRGASTEAQSTPDAKKALLISTKPDPQIGTGAPEKSVWHLLMNLDSKRTVAAEVLVKFTDGTTKVDTCELGANGITKYTFYSMKKGVLAIEITSAKFK